MDTAQLDVSEEDVATLLADPSRPLGQRTFWRLLYESEVRIDELLALDITDVRLVERILAVSESKEGPREVEVSEAAANELALIIAGHSAGPVFALPDGTRLSWERAHAAFRDATGRPLRALRNSRLRREFALVAQAGAAHGGFGHSVS
ncbi:tyrosine-type recombinase/integrase [Streptomyces olivoreticuli]|uniref:tyrosine-type recombinase/integrase n=1 Tax=Streptomyces olivoreticuli TaxID=68246 RepID=UPI0013C2DB54|nr:tyrosine-type recombinase/integrase [Streptomyces olivoreticuli]